MLRINLPMAVRIGAIILASSSPAILAGCDEDPAPPRGLPFEIRDSFGVQIILNGQSGPADAETQVLQEDLRLGKQEGEEPLLFFRIADIALEPDGTIYVGNGQTCTIRVFSRTGEFLREFGGRGDGPEEVRGITDLWVAGDSVVVVDQSRPGKVLVFTKTGEFVSSWGLSLPDGRRLLPSGLGPAGWIGTYSPPPQPISIPPGEVWMWDRDLVRLFFPGDSVGEVVVDIPAERFYGSRTMGGPDRSLFAPSPEAGFDEQGNIFLSPGSSYEIDVYTPLGELRRRVRRSYDPIPITDADIQQITEEILAPIDTMSDLSPQDRQSLTERWTGRVVERATFPRPTFRPPLRRLLVSPDGGFWVERIDGLPPVEPEKAHLYAISSMAESVSFWDVFDDVGTFGGTVRLPIGFTPMATAGNAVVGVQTDSLGVEYVVRFLADNRRVR